MAKINHRKINSKEDVDKKLKRYQRINKQISKKLADKRLEYANCKKALHAANAEIMNLQVECRMWKTKFSDLRQRVDQIQSITNDIQMNAVKTNNMSDDDIDETKNSNRLVDKPVKLSRNPGDLRHILKFVSTRKRKKRRKMQCESIWHFH